MIQPDGVQDAVADAGTPSTWHQAAPEQATPIAVCPEQDAGQAYTAPVDAHLGPLLAS